MKVITLQQRLRFLIVILTIGMLAILAFVIYPNTKKILSLKEQIDETEALLETRYQLSRRTEHAVVDITSAVSSTGRYTELTMPQDAELALIQAFETIANVHAIDQHLNVSYSDKSDGNTKLTTYTFSFLNHGLWQDHIAYFHEVLSLPYIVSIESIDIQRRNTSDTAKKVDDALSQSTVRFTAIVYAK